MFGLSRRNGSGSNLVMASFITVSAPAKQSAEHARLHVRSHGVAPSHKALLASLAANPPALSNRLPAAPRPRGGAGL